MKNEIKEIAKIVIKELDKNTDGTFYTEEIATALHKAGYRKQEDTVKEFAEKIMDKNCRNCEHAFLETCKGCNTLPPNNTYENFELRKDIAAEKHRADVAEEALKLAVFDYKACVENEVCKKYKTKAEKILYIREQTEIEMDKILSMLKEKKECAET